MQTYGSVNYIARIEGVLPTDVSIVDRIRTPRYVKYTYMVPSGNGLGFSLKSVWRKVKRGAAAVAKAPVTMAQSGWSAAKKAGAYGIQLPGKAAYQFTRGFTEVGTGMASGFFAGILGKNWKTWIALLIAGLLGIGGLIAYLKYFRRPTGG